MDRPYPAHWEADVVLADGRTAHLRPIRPDDAQRLIDFYADVSDESKYLRFFAPYPQLSARDVHHFTNVDYKDRVAFVALIGDEIIGVGRYERVEDPRVPPRGVRTAEVAFLVQDAHQGRGLGSVLLEHLAAAAKERGIQRFVAEMLPENRRMVAVFTDAGYSIRRTVDGGVVVLVLDLTETETAASVRAAREHRAEARSVRRLLHPRSVVVVGASRREHSVGQTVLRNLVEVGFSGPVHVVHREADEVAGVRAHRRVLDVPGPLDLAVVAVPTDGVEEVVAQCAARNVAGLVVVSAGFAETGELGTERQHRLVRLARANGMRVVGPNSFGVINTAPEVCLNASLSPVMPPPGHAGFFSQSGALGGVLLASAAARGIGISTFVSAGNRADVSDNDLLQYWEDDPVTRVVLLYLESIGNPRKFSRIARRIGRVKPVVAVRSGRTTQGVPLGHSVRRSRAPLAAVDALFAQAGVVRVDDAGQLLDVAAVLLGQPLPQGSRVAVIGNARSLGLLATDAAVAAGLTVVGDPIELGAEASAADFDRALAAVHEDPAVDSIVAVFVPPLLTADEDVARVLAASAGRGTKTMVAAFLGMRGADLLRDPSGTFAVPSYVTPEDAVRALALATQYAAWRRRPPGRVPTLADVDTAAARRWISAALAEHPGGTELARDAVAALLGCYGIGLWPLHPARTAEEAAEAAAAVGYPVVLRNMCLQAPHRPEPGDVRVVADEPALRQAWAALAERLGSEGAEHLVVQQLAPPGEEVVIGSMEDPLFGPVVSFGVAGLATELLGDRAYRIPPLTDVDAAGMVRSVRAATLLFGYRGSPPVDVAALEDLLLRVGRLADDLPEVAELELSPVVVAPQGLAVLGARGALARPLLRTDRGTRALPS